MAADLPGEPVTGMPHGRTDEGFLVPPTGGYVEQEDAWGRRELWLGWTNYPAPYWNRWTWRRMHGRTIEGPFGLWWYGEWV